MNVKVSGRGSYQVWGGQVWVIYDKGYIYYGDTPKHKGMCSDLGVHVFDYNQKSSEDQMSNTREEILHHVITIHGHGIRNKLLNNKNSINTKQDHNQDEFDEHQLANKISYQSYQCLTEARQFQKGVYEEKVKEG